MRWKCKLSEHAVSSQCGFESTLTRAEFFLNRWNILCQYATASAYINHFAYCILNSIYRQHNASLDQIFARSHWHSTRTREAKPAYAYCLRIPHIYHISVAHRELVSTSALSLCSTLPKHACVCVCVCTLEHMLTILFTGTLQWVATTMNNTLRYRYGKPTETRQTRWTHKKYKTMRKSGAGRFGGAGRTKNPITSINCMLCTQPSAPILCTIYLRVYIYNGGCLSLTRATPRGLLLFAKDCSCRRCRRRRYRRTCYAKYLEIRSQVMLLLLLEGLFPE